MGEIHDICMAGLNDIGREFCDYASGMLIQTCVLAAILLCVDRLLRKRVRATIRYWIWMLVFVKLLLPPGLCAPTGIGYWLHRDAPVVPPAVLRPVELAKTPITAEMPMPPIQPSEPMPEPASPVGVGSESISWQGGVFLLWIAGVLVFGAMVVQRWSLVKRLIRRGEPAPDDLVDLLDGCRGGMGVHARIGLRLLPNAFSPAVCGLLRPTILMPRALLDRLSPEGLRTVLIHELAHVKRGDLWINSLQTILQVAYFYNPLVWLASAIVRRVREQAVDEMALVALGAEAKSYGNTLIDIAEMAFLRVSPALRLIGVAESRKSLEGRIQHMITRPIPKNARVGIAGVLVIAAMGAILLPMAAAGTQTAKQSPFTATLTNGATVELIGVCNWPAGGPVCWEADGSPLDKPLRATKGNMQTDAHNYGFMLRVRGPEDVEVRWNSIEGADSWEGTCDVVDIQGSRLDDCTAAVASLPGKVTRTSLRVGVAAGPWTTVSTHDGRQMGYSGKAGVLWSQAFEDSDGTSVVATAEWRKDRTERIVAIDRAGAMHASPGGSVAVGNMDQMTTRFDGLKRGQIKEFQYQVRPYEWADFKDVSLRPELGTAPRVEWVRAGKGSDAAIEGFKVQPGRTEDMYTAVVSIRNRGEAASPQLIVRFRVGDRTVDAVTHLAGPLKPGEVWNEGSSDFVPTDGVHTIQVSLDPDDQVEELDETNNQATLRLVVKDGKVVEQSAAPAANGPDDQEQAALAKSAETLGKLIRAALIWSNDHGDRLPDSVTVLEDKLNPADKEWLSKNAAYLGKGMSLWAEDPGHVVAYDKTLLAKGNGTNVVYLDCHVAFENPRKLETLGIVATDSGAVRQDNEGEAFRSYQVNRSVADFPAGEDFSTPEAAYATINRMDRDDPAAWKKVSVARLAARMGGDGSDRKRAVDPEWAKVMANARIREVVVWNVTKASVIAELPQELSSKKIVDPFDVRYLQLENGRWLNMGNDRFASVEAAKAKFMSWIQRETAEADAMRDPLAHADEIKAAAAQLFEKLCTANYAKILSYYHDGKWDDDGWKQFPTLGLYTVGTNYPSFALWCATHFKDNPIIDVQLGEVFIGDALVADKTGRPTVPYKLTLKDGSTLAGNLPFYLSQGEWIGLEGIDWHLWPNGMK